MPFHVHVLRNTQGRLYIGSTENLEKRVLEHQNGETRWTRTRGPWELVYSESFLNRASALRRERTLKRGRANQQLRRQLSR